MLGETAPNFRALGKLLRGAHMKLPVRLPRGPSTLRATSLPTFLSVAALVIALTAFGSADDQHSKKHTKHSPKAKASQTAVSKSTAVAKQRNANPFAEMTPEGRNEHAGD